jgi:hypothetical protein
VSDGFALAVQVGIRARLVAVAAVTALVSTRVYDEPPQPVTYPYVRFGDIVPEAYDTDTKTGARVDIAIEAHSRSASGRVEAARICEAIRAALHRQESAVTVAGHTLIELIVLTYQVSREPEGRGHTGVVLVQALIET